MHAPTFRLLRPVRRRARPLAFALLCGLGPVPSAPLSAAIHACTLEDGHTVFQDRPCERRAPSTGAATPTRSTPPAGIHPSWFERPLEVVERARCDERECRCGSIRRSLDGTLPTAVADALYLDAAWHTYRTSVEAWRRNEPGGPDRDTLRRLGEEAACDVAISQQILNLHAEDVLGGLRALTREAEERGLDDPGACRAGNADACGYLDALALYRRMLDDLAVLRTPREAVTAEE